uniref:Uncharacterized protein n=1 Tax=Meloidogyne enterolobii TaxID=390850 RepID=A0A6V7WHM3_MELEN|nr:unnamed protein product [Meloidogyne enterolobii]
MQNVLIEKKKAIDQADILKIEHKRIYDLYTIQQTEFKDMKIQNENLASENKKLKLDFENLQEENGNLKLINDSFNTKISKLTSDIEKKRMHFVKIENKINRISSQFTCCESKCINNSNLSNGTCFNGMELFVFKMMEK